MLLLRAFFPVEGWGKRKEAGHAEADMIMAPSACERGMSACHARVGRGATLPAGRVLKSLQLPRNLKHLVEPTAFGSGVRTRQGPGRWKKNVEDVTLPGVFAGSPVPPSKTATVVVHSLRKQSASSAFLTSQEAGTARR